MPRTDLDPSWRDKAFCRNADPEIFFALERGSSDGSAFAKKFCDRCIAKPECYQEFVIDRPQEFGVYAGLTPVERKQARARHFGWVVPV